MLKGRRDNVFTGALAKEDRNNLIILFSCGLLLRLYAFSQIYLISIDGAFQYIPVAKLFFQGDYVQALTQPQLPLYPFLIGIFSHITGDFELAGQLISIVFSLLAVLPLYLIGKSLFGPGAGFWAAALYIIHPLMLQCSVDVLKEGLLIFAFFSSVYYSLRFLQEGKGIWLFWTVAFAVVGALARILILEILMVLGLWLGYGALRGRLRERRLAYRYLWVVVPILGGILVFVIAGIWEWDLLTTKKMYGLLHNFFVQGFGDQRPYLSQIGAGTLYILGRFVEKAYPVPFLLALFGLGWRIKVRGFDPEERYLILLMAILIISFFPNLYASARYLLPAIFLLYLWAGFGFAKIWELLARRFPRHPLLNAMIPIVALLITSIPFSLQPQRLDKIGRKEVGLWLREQSASSPVIITNIPRVAYYAEGKYESIPPGMPTEKIVQRAKWKKADYLIIEEKGSSIAKSLSPFEQKGDLKLVYRHLYGKRARTIYAYRLRGKSK